MANKTKNFQVMSNVFIRRKIPENGKNIEFDDNSFEIYLLIDGKENLYDIYKRTNLNKNSFIQALNKLFRQGLIVRVSEEEVLSKEDVEKITFLLAECVGPLAEVVLADAFSALGYSANDFPKPKTRLLIGKITEQIPFDKAIKFRESIQSAINME